MKMSPFLCVTLLVAAAPATAAAEPQAEITHPLLVVEGSGGLATPLGLVGLSAEVRPLDRVAIAAGVGYGFTGFQISAMSRVDVIQAGESALAIGAGLSIGQYSEGQWLRVPGTTGYTHDWDWARWANVEISATRWLNANNRLRLFAGASTLLNPGDSSCTAEDEDGEFSCGPGERFEDHRVLPYLGAAITFGGL